MTQSDVTHRLFDVISTRTQIRNPLAANNIQRKRPNELRENDVIVDVIVDEIVDDTKRSIDGIGLEIGKVSFCLVPCSTSFVPCVDSLVPYSYSFGPFRDATTVDVLKYQLRAPRKEVVLQCFKAMPRGGNSRSNSRKGFHSENSCICVEEKRRKNRHPSPRVNQTSQVYTPKTRR